MVTAARRLLRFGYRQLYTSFAWTYDAVAAAVSLGEWKAWGRAVIPFIPTNNALPILELAHGPGHLLLWLRQHGYGVVGLDLSPQMGAMAQRRLLRAGLSNSLARASVYRLPFAAGAFGTAISTFPTEFILAPQVLHEVWRVLADGGRLLAVPGAPLHTTGALTHALRLTQSLSQLSATNAAAIRTLFMEAGFSFEEQRVSTRHADVIVWICGKAIDC